MICVWTLQVSSAQNFLIRTGPLHSPLLGKPPPPVYLRGPLVPYFVPPPPALRSAAPPNSPMHSLHVPPSMLPAVGRHPLAHHPLNVPPSAGRVPHSKLPVSPHHLPNVPQLLVTPPHSVPQHTLRSVHHPVSPLGHLPALLPLLLNKPSPRLADPRHLHVHHHIHHGGELLHHSDLSHGGLHTHHHHLPAAPPVHHHHFHAEPHGVVIKKTLIKKFRDGEAQPHPLRRFRRTLPAVLAAKLATDPRSKVDLMGTLDNVKDATKAVCESIQSPVYHVRDAIGSARDVLFSVLKMSPTGLLVPSTYGIMELKPGDEAETTGAINPEIAKYVPNFDGKAIATELTTNEISDANPDETLTAVQFMLRNGFRKARDSVQHAGDAVHSMRRAVLTAPRSAVKLLYPFYKSIELGQDGDGLRPAGFLGAKPVEPDPTPRLVGAGRLLELLRAATASESARETVSARFGGVSTAASEGREKYRNFINKIRNDVRERFQSLD